MASTTNRLKLQIINPSDYVDPGVINDNMEILDNLGVDYIVESGQTGQWTYRKYKSGIVECWATVEFAATTQQFGIQCPVQLPFQFSSPPMANVSGGIENRNDGYVQYVRSSTTQVDIWMYKHTTENLKRWVYVHVIGRVS